ncbi:MAG: TrkH family potassium uptake protein [Proteobacteria bacterium]|nr:TrkH family potassium uptake protein [Pseudomonadota bacterium]
MRPHVIFRYAGIVLLFNALFLTLSACISGFKSDTALYPLTYTALIALMFGIFPLIFVPPVTNISNKEGFVIVVSGWITSCVIGAMPYVLWGGEFSLTNAWFESVSGFTTTGSSILTDVEILPAGLLFWRAATHWIGGIGIIVFVLAVLPSSGNIGMVLYRSEASSLSMENFHYRTKKSVQILAVVYVGLTLAHIVALLLCGMNLFDSVTHAFASIATGGFSTKNLSIAHFHSLSVEMVFMAFMLISGIHFGLLFSVSRGKVMDFYKNPILRYYLAAMTTGILLVAVNLHLRSGYDWGHAFRVAGFQVITIGTSTGFATEDSSIWPSFSQLVLIFFTLQGACAGSTSGGIKVDRIIIFWKGFLKRIQIVMHPRAVVMPKINNMSIDQDTIEATTIFIVIYLAIIFISSLLLTFIGVDGLSAFSGSAACMGGVGPGFGTVGSTSNFSHIPTPGKWILSLTMLFGRLEVFGLLLMFMLRRWR